MACGFGLCYPWDMTKRAAVELDFVLYAGDPDAGASAHPSRDVLETFEGLRGAFDFGSVLYGAVTISREGEELADRKPEPIVRLLTSIVRSVSYVLDGEPETVLLAESAHGFLFEMQSNEVLVSFFRGEDAFEPEEIIVEPQGMDAVAWSSQVIEMADRMVEIYKRARPSDWDGEECAGDILEFLEMAKETAKTYRLARERGLR